MATVNLALPGVANNTATLINYTLRSCNDNSVHYVGTNATDTLAAPRLIDVKLSPKAPGVVGNDRVNVSFKQVKLDENNVPGTSSVSTTVSISRNPSFVAEDIVSLLRQSAAYMNGVATALEGQTDVSGFAALWAKLLIP